MKRFKHNFYKGSIIGGVALIYAALVVLSTGCALAHANQSQTHHHHHEENSSPQSVFCAWACQATSDVAMAPESPKAMAWLVVESTVLIPDPLLTSSGLSILRSRGPPLFTLVLWG
ncbi:MAG: hypothetical protein ACT4PN_06545 [Nitrospiraceae bacterium]